MLGRNARRTRAWVDDFDSALAGGLIFAGSPRTVRDALVKFIDESGIPDLAELAPA